MELNMDLDLPGRVVPDRVSLGGGAGYLEAGETRTLATLDGPGCIRHLWVCMTRSEHANRQAVMRIFFDGEPVPHVEAPVGDFFGVMHGRTWYPINTKHISVQYESGYNCYFPMPFAESARIEFEAGEQDHPVYLFVDWHRYPGQTLTEKRRFCARWRREFPTQRYGEAFLMLDADGPGELAGFAYGVRLMDDTDRWSHGGGDNIYIDGEGEHPAYLRGIGGEDTFGTSYGGALHPPETHLHASLPYYVHEDVGQPRPAQRVAGYRFFDPDRIPFQRSVHMRFGCMENDVCSTVWWYGEKPVRPFFRMPPWPLLSVKNSRPHTVPAEERIPRGAYDLPLPDSGSWWLCGPFGNQDGRAMAADLPPEREPFAADACFDGVHEEGSAWLTPGSKALGRDQARWVRRAAIHGFVDFNHVFPPAGFGAGLTHPGVAVARCTLSVPAAMTASLRIAFDDHALLRVNGETYDLGDQAAFRVREITAPLNAGDNTVSLKLSNTLNTNHGGWCFAFQAAAPDGTRLHPNAVD